MSPLQVLALPCPATVLLRERIHVRGTGRPLSWASASDHRTHDCRTACVRHEQPPTTATADALLAALQRDLPAMRQDMDAFFGRFEARAYAVFALEDSPRVQQRLQDMLRDAGIE